MLWRRIGLDKGMNMCHGSGGWTGIKMKMNGYMKVSDISIGGSGIVTVRQVTRVNWLRAKARSKRWEEEVLLLQNEMIWTQRWFGHNKKKWEARMEGARIASKAGHHAYAAKQ